jgi:predicted transposase/invertase (TIGR01784 family)
MASQTLVNISRNEIERARLLSEYKYEVDLQSKVVQAKRDGRKEGRKEGKLEIARNLKGTGIPLQQIAVWTGLSPDDITTL